MAILLDGLNNAIDATNPDNLSDRVLSERETRKKLLTHARLAEVDRGLKGIEREMLMCFAKYDRLMKNCKNAQEKADIAALGAVEIYTILGRGGELFVNGQLVCKDR
jgi:hypothetical protein